MPNPYRYVKPPVAKSHGDGFVGIFWINNDGMVIPVSCSVDQGRNDGVQISMHGVTHLTSFKDGIKKLSAFPDMVEHLQKMAYNQLERGRVVFDLQDNMYEVTVSADTLDNILINDVVGDNIIKAFHLPKANTEFKYDNRYAASTT